MSTFIALERTPTVSLPLGRNRWLALCGGLLAIGMLLTGYLLWRSLMLIGGAAAGADLCSAVFGHGCDEVLASDRSWWLGVPMAGWGLAYFTLLTVLLMLGWLFREDFADESRQVVRFIALGGAGVSGWLAFTMVRGAAPHCPLCWAMHVINLGVLLTAWRSTGLAPRALVPRLLAALRYAAGAPAADAVAAKRRMLYVSMAIGAAGFAYQWSYVQAAVRKASSSQPDPQAMIDAFEKAPQVTIHVTADDARIGSVDAPAQFVVFSDFQCPACRRLANDLHALSQRFGKDMSIVFKNYPLSSQCNASLRVDMHPLACLAAKATIAAAAQGKFWPLHDALFEADWKSMNDSPAAFEEWIQTFAHKAGLDLRRFDEDRRADAVAARIAADVAEGNRLHIEGTPTLFLNGRQVDRADRGTLGTLLRHVTEHAR